MKKIEILIVDDHPIFLSGLRLLLDANKDMKVCGEASNGQDAISKARELDPDIVIMDINMPGMNGIEATKELLSMNPERKVLALSINSGEQVVKEMLKAGAEGYLLKDEAPEELVKAIHKVLDGDIYLSSGITRVALQKENKGVNPISKAVLKTKLVRPTVNQFMFRDRLTDELEDNIAKPLSLTSASAGYGKSVAISQWLTQTKCLSAWISIDEEHNDLRIFLSYLVFAMNEVLQEPMRNTENAISGTELPPQKDLVYILFSDLCEVEEEVILVLDDYYKIHENNIHEILNEWLRFPPPNIHLSIITRRDPPLNLNSLKLAGRMIEIRMDKLSFTKEEIKEYFSMQGIDLNDQVISTLQDKTEGWIIALSLSLMVIQNAENTEEVVNNIEGNLSTISDYLLTEVLTTQSNELQELLLISSILNRFCAELLDHIHITKGNLNRKQMIAYLRRSNMFLIGLDYKNEWFRYHHLFQDLLKDQLNKKYSEEKVKQFHLNASNWFEENGFLEEAMDHAIEAMNYTQAIDIIKQHRMDLIAKDNYFTLEHLQRKIPESIIEHDSELLVVEEYLCWNNYEMLRLVEVVDRCQSLLKEQDENTMLEAENRFFNGFRYLFQGDSASHLKGIKKSMKNIPVSAHGARQVVEMHYLIYSQTSGEYENSKAWFSESLERINEFPDSRRNWLYSGIMVANLDEADLEEMEKIYPKALEVGRKSQLNNRGNIIKLTGNLMMRKGRWKESIEYFNEGLKLKYIFFARSVVDMMTGFIIVNGILGNYTTCGEMIKQFHKYVDNTGEYLNTYLWSCRVRYQMIRNNEQKVRELLPAYQATVFDVIMWMDIPDITYVRALVFEGSDESLKIAEAELERLIPIFFTEHNWIHLLEVYAVQALFFEKQGKSEEAREALSKSIELAENGGAVGFYIELGAPMLNLIQTMQDDFRNKPVIEKIIQGINDLLALTKKLPAKEREKKTEMEQLNVLTSSEIRVLECVAEGLRNQEIAEKLFNSEETIKKHIYNMFQKLHVKNRLSLVKRAREEGII